MRRFIPIFHGLVAGAPWGVACVHDSAVAGKAELMVLCRTESEAAHYASLVGLGEGLKSYRDQKLSAGGASAGRKTT